MKVGGSGCLSQERHVGVTVSCIAAQPHRRGDPGGEESALWVHEQDVRAHWGSWCSVPTEVSSQLCPLELGC